MLSADVIEQPILTTPKTGFFHHQNLLLAVVITASISGTASAGTTDNAYLGCIARDYPAKTTYYSKTAYLKFGIDFVARKNAQDFKNFIIEKHGARKEIHFQECDFVFTNQADLDVRYERNKKIDAKTGFRTVNVDWTPQNVK
jgi:hypothetical protein